jgi:hypothetical protein
VPSLFDLCSLVVGLVSVVIGLLFECVVCRSVVLWCVVGCCFMLDFVALVGPCCPQLFGFSCCLYGSIVFACYIRCVSSCLFLNSLFCDRLLVSCLLCCLSLVGS